jgi:purine-binding chemotaxis protein CheW
VNSTIETDLVCRAGKYLTFELAGELYGLEILRVQEIIGVMSITRVPKSPDFIRGVLDLRGKVIPVVDLRMKFGLSRCADTERTCIVIMQVRATNLTVGIVVDEVREVVEIAAGQIEPAPSFGAAAETDFITGIGKVSQKVVMLLDLDRALSFCDGTEAE